MQVQVKTVTTSDQQTLCVKTWGDQQKTPLVLVHGYPDNQEVWEPIIEKLVNDYFVVTYDVRGRAYRQFQNVLKIIVCRAYL